MKRYPRSRSAAVLVAALVCLLIALSIATTLIAETIVRRAQLQVEGRARQADLLVQAGQGRAAARLALDSGYSGERWKPEIGQATATVEITVESDDDGAPQVTIVAVYPEGNPKAVRRSQTFTFTSADPSTQE